MRRKRTKGAQIRGQHPLMRFFHNGQDLVHKKDCRLNEDIGIRGCAPLCQGEGIADNIRRILNVGRHIIVGQHQRVPFLFETLYLRMEPAFFVFLDIFGMRFWRNLGDINGRSQIGLVNHGNGFRAPAKYPLKALLVVCWTWLTFSI